MAISVALGLALLVRLALVGPASSAVTIATAVEIVVWSGCLALLCLRDRERRFRISDPGTLVLVWAGFYFMTPALRWLSGARFALEYSSGYQLTPLSVARVQWLQTAFMACFTLAYVLVAPRKTIEGRQAPMSTTTDDLPSPTWVLLIGLAPVVLEVVTRLYATGSLRPVSSYGESWYDLQDTIRESRQRGGSDYVLTQFTSKVGYFPLMSLGAGSGIVLARLLRQRRWLGLGLFHLGFVILMYLGTGGRHVVIMPFLVALFVADYIVGPLRWRYVATVGILGVSFFNFYGEFRRHQNEELGQALEKTTSERKEDSKLAAGEEDAMLVKNAYAIDWAESTGRQYGLGYFVEGALVLVPQQILPDKPNWFNGADFLSKELLGRDAKYGAGVAGAIVADGYLVMGALGVVLLAVVMGLAGGIGARLLLSAADSPPLWRLVLYAFFAAQSVFFIRGDLATIVTQAFYYLALPAVMVNYLLEQSSRWWSKPALVS